jgi:hypothetical protein
MERKVYKGNVVQAGDHIVRARTRERAWRKLHRRIARDVVRGDRTHLSILPESYKAKLFQARMNRLRRWFMERGLFLP